MTIDLESATLAPSWPAGAGARAATGGVDEPLLHDLAQRSFADHWGFTPTPYEEWLHWLREIGEYDPTLCFVAEHDGVPAGVVIGRVRGARGPTRRAGSRSSASCPSTAGAGSARRFSLTAFAEHRRRGLTRGGLGVDAENTTGAVRLYERVGMTVAERQDIWELRRVSTLRARCPDCRTLTAVAFDDGYECHSCGADVRGRARARAARLGRGRRDDGRGRGDPGSGTRRRSSSPRTTLEEQTAAIAAGLPQRPLVLGGCCCAHLGAIRGLAARHGRLAVVWLDAHGDLNTPETSPSGNAWGMPLRLALDEGSVAPADVALVGARDLDPPEEAYVAEHGIDDDLERALAGADAVYVALDVRRARAGHGVVLHARARRARTRARSSDPASTSPSGAGSPGSG